MNKMVCCCILAMAMELKVNAEELEIASLIRTKCIDETKPHLKKNKNGILYISDRFEKHLKELNKQEVYCGKEAKKNWLNAKFKNKHIQSVKNVITSELCRIYCNINPYTSGRYTDKSDDVLLLDNKVNASGQQIFKDIDKYDIGNWNYIFLINYMNWLKNNGKNNGKNNETFSTPSTDELLSNRLQKIIETLRTKGVNITDEMRSNMQKAKQDIVYYVENLKLKDFWQSIYDDKDRNGNYINHDPNNKEMLLASQNDNFYTNYKIDKKTGAPYGIANVQSSCHIATVIEMLYSNKKIRDKIKTIATDMNTADTFNSNDIDVNDNNSHTDQNKRAIIEDRDNYGNSSSKQVAFWLNCIFNRLDKGLVSSAYILELSNMINKCNIINAIMDARNNGGKYNPKLNPYRGDDPNMSLDALISALAGVDFEFDKGSLDLIKQDLGEKLDEIKNNGESSINQPTMSESVKNELIKLAKRQESAKRIIDKVGLEDYITRMSEIGSLICVKREETVIKKDGNDISKSHPKPNTTHSYARTISISRSCNDLQECLNRTIQKTEIENNVQCFDCTEENNNNAVYHTKYTEEKYVSSPSVLILAAEKDPYNKEKFSKLNIPDYLTAWGYQYVLRSAIVKQPRHYIMKGIAQNGDIYCIDDDGSAIMRPDPEKPGTAHYEMSKGRQMNDKRHQKNSAIQGDKTLNHLDVEDGVLFMYERVDW